MAPPVKRTVLLDGKVFDWENPNIEKAKKDLGVMWKHYTEDVGPWHPRKSVFARMFPDINVAASIIDQQRRLGMYDTLGVRNNKIGEILTDLRNE